VVKLGDRCYGRFREDRRVKRKGNGSSGDSVIDERPNTGVLYAAYEFHDAAKLLNITKRSRSWLLTYETATVVNAAFALELYLKCLNSARIVLDEPFEIDGFQETAEIDIPRMRGHSLLKLFASLEDGARRYLESEYLRSPASAAMATLESALGFYDQTFEKSRYHFESVPADSLDTDAMFRLLDFFRTAAKTIPRRK
jgi:hypothetical protein